MTAVTQLIPSYLGGVSKQTDDKKKPGQVNDIVNGMPDITYGLLKRSGFNWIRNVVDSNGESLDYAKWFFVTRGGLDAYVGCITNNTGSNGNISVWNAITGVQSIVEYPDGTDYLDVSYNADIMIGPEQLYSVTTIQDVTVITNTDKVVEEMATPGEQKLQNGTVKILIVEYGSDYTVSINNKEITYKTRNFDDAADESAVFLDADEILSSLKAGIESAGLPLTVTQFSDCLEIVMTGDNEITFLEAVGGNGNSALDAYATDVTDVSKLSVQALDGRKVQIINGAGEEDDYWLQFESEFTEGGVGSWIECRDPAASAGFENNTAPHELEFSSETDGVATFKFKQIVWVDRIAGDETTNPMPSFVGKKVSFAFFYSNRFGLLAEDYVCLSMANDIFNFFKRSAQILVDSDPIDSNVSSIAPVRLISARPEPQGLVLFGNSEQFRMYSVDSVLTPSTAQIRTLSTYEIANFIPPESLGTSSAFISKVPSYTRCFLYETKGLEEAPAVIDIGKTVAQWIPENITSITTSPQNSLVCLSSSRSRNVYLYRYYNSGEKDLFQAWASWTMPGVTIDLQIINDQVFAITKQGDQYTLLVNDLNENSRNNIIKTPIPFVDYELWSNPYLDMMFQPSAEDLTYDSATNTTIINLPFNSVDYLTPTVMLTADPVGPQTIDQDLLSLSAIYSTVQADRSYSNTESGYYTTPTVEGNTWIIPGDITDTVGRLICGYRYLFEIEFPTMYYNAGDQKYDYTANLTIARHKFSVGFTGALQFSVQAAGRSEWTPTYQVTDADNYLANTAPLIKDRVFTVPIYQRNKTYKLKVQDTTPFPTSLISQMWEGNYVPRFYQRKIK